MTRVMTLGAIIVVAALVAHAHDVTTNVTWNREVSRIFYARCAACHRPGGSAFSLMSYQEASPWARAIKDAVLTRSMPPWGAVKGFGSFRNDQALTQEEIDLVERWINGGSPEGNPNDLPARPKIALPPAVESWTGELVVSGDYRLPRPFVLDGFVVRVPPSGGTARITIEFPDGRIAPLVWFDGHPAQRQQPFLLRAPLSIPAGASMRGLAGSTLVLLPPAHPR